MFDSPKKIEELITCLEQRGVELYHACQLDDFITYLELGGVPSRSLMERESARFTAFESDEIDVVNNVWDKIFFNLSDSGRWFHGTSAVQVPNIFGPILLQFSPRLLITFNDVSLTLRSASAVGFDRVRESLISDQEVDLLFKSPRSARYPADLKLAFTGLPFVANRGLQTRTAPELNCATITGDQVAEFSYLTKVLVDPVSWDGAVLFDVVKDHLETNGLGTGVLERRRSRRADIYQELLRLAVYGPSNLSDAILSVPDGESTQGFLQVLERRGRQLNYSRFIQYLREGTLTRLGAVGITEVS